MQRIRNAKFTVYQVFLSFLGKDCVAQYIYYFDYTKNDNEEADYGKRN